ncbi:ATP-dependent nuclease [Coprothermobacter platensis]|uniref:ATP-dependent nuclease n=1 Tax=Coprothermobacter platensis TaxID=108819 RepID=UPI00037FDC22|nr:AAA family ATPase [Coprothermobacter platensis]
MRPTLLEIKNFRALQDVKLNLHNFTALTGKNNVGKSSILQAISLFFSGSKLEKSDYFNENLSIQICIKFENISDEDLELLVPEHREKVTKIMDICRSLILVREYDLEGKSKLCYIKMEQNDLESSEIKPVPTGIDKGILRMLPIPVYVPAVRDFSDDVKTTESAPFGKLLSMLLDEIQQEQMPFQKLLTELDNKINIQENEDGTKQDNRLQQLKTVEKTLEKYVRESFGEIELQITVPLPDMKSIFSSASILIDDGLRSSIDSKGDGLRRLVTFSILRSYVDLKSKGISSETSSGVAEMSVEGSTKTCRRPYFLLFEEPELFLHPQAQNVLFQTLQSFAKDNYVFITTHSPTFLSPETTDSFVKVVKVIDGSYSKPYTKIYEIDLTDFKNKDLFQIINFDNNNAALFYDTVVLVEGESDRHVFSHIARILNQTQDTKSESIAFAKMSGKDNIKRYRDFFERFGVRVLVIADLDLMIRGFDKVVPSEDMVESRNKMIKRIDEINHMSKECSANNACIKNGKDDYKDKIRYKTLKENCDHELIELKQELISQLRENNIFVLEKGEIEDYYPSGLEGNDKVSRALNFCRNLRNKEDILKCCNYIAHPDGTKEKEFELIFGRIFENVDSMSSTAFGE